jgi:hypothetical protein
MQSYFIETSIGRVHFQTIPIEQSYTYSDVVDRPQTRSVKSNSKSMSVIPTDPDHFKLFFEMFVHDGFEIKKTEYGDWFLFVKLDDPYYGMPEYKLFVI